MYAAMAFLAKIASDYRKPNGRFRDLPDLAEAPSSGVPSRDGPLTTLFLITDSIGAKHSRQWDRQITRRNATQFTFQAMLLATIAVEAATQGGSASIMCLPMRLFWKRLSLSATTIIELARRKSATTALIVHRVTPFAPAAGPHIITP
jgi:hypothetical protein